MLFRVIFLEPVEAFISLVNVLITACLWKVITIESIPLYQLALPACACRVLLLPVVLLLFLLALCLSVSQVLGSIMVRGQDTGWAAAHPIT